MFLSLSTEPLTLDQVYSSCLDSLGIGHALWEPEPNDTGEVQFGDVGFVHEGSFVRLFNLDPSVEEWKVTRWEPAYQPETLPEGALKIRRTPNKFDSGDYCSHGVYSTEMHGSATIAAGAPVSAGLEVGYACRTSQGAALTLKSDAHGEGIYSSRRLKRHIARHYDRWLAYARDDADHDIKHGDLIVVTSCVKTNPDWTACVFTHRNSSAHLSLEGNAGGAASISAGVSRQTAITTKPIQRRGRLYHAQGHTVGPALTRSDQCVTIKRLKVRRRWFFRLVAGAGYHRLPDPDDYKRGYASRRASSEDEVDIPGLEDQGADADFLDILLAYELEVSGARLAVGDDDEIETLLSGQPVIDFASYLRRTQPRVETDGDGIAFLCVEDLIRSEQEQRFGYRDSVSYNYVKPPRVAGSSQSSTSLFDHFELPQTALEHSPSHPVSALSPSVSGSVWPSTNSSHDLELPQTALEHRPSHPPITAADRVEWPQISHKDAGTLTDSHIWLGPSQAKARPVKYKSVVFGDAEKMQINNHRCVSLSTDGKLLAAATGQKIIVWRLQDGLTVQRLEEGGYAGAITEVASSPNTQYIISGVYDGLALVWNIKTGGIVHRLAGHEGPVTSAVFSPDGTQIATRSTDSLRLWDALTGELLHSMEGLQSEPSSLIFTLFPPDGSRIATFSYNWLSGSDMMAWDCYTGERVAAVQRKNMHCMTFSPEGDHIAAGCRDGSADVFDAASGKVLLKLEQHTSPVWEVAFSPDGGEVATAADDGTVVTFDSRTGEHRFTFRAGGVGGIGGEFVRTVAYSPQNDFIACGADNGCIWVWHRKTGAFVAAFQGHTDWVRRVIFTPDGWDLLSSGDDCVVRLWSVQDALRLS